MSRSQQINAARIPYIDLARQNGPLMDELLDAVSAIARAQSFVLGEAVRQLESAVAEYVGARFGVGVANGTDALYLSMRALDLEPGDEIITTPFTFFGTAGAIQNAGARIVFADIEPNTFNLYPDAVADAIGARTRAIVAVHLFGQMADIGRILEVASDSGVEVIEDAAQAIGARAVVAGSWKTAGSLGLCGCFSFYPTKNLGGWGDGGLIATNDERAAERLSRLRAHGRSGGLGEHRHAEVGTNSRLDAIQAAILRAKLKHLPGWTEARRARAAAYDQALANIDGVRTPPAEHDRFHVYNLYTIRAARRDELRAHLQERGIGTAVYYPMPLHLQPCFAELGHREGEFPEAERAAREALSLPIFAELTLDEVERVAATVREFYVG